MGQKRITNQDIFLKMVSDDQEMKNLIFKGTPKIQSQS